MEAQPETPDTRQPDPGMGRHGKSPLIGRDTATNVGIAALVVTVMIFGFSNVNSRIDDNTAELRLIRGNVQDLTERMAAVETVIGLRAQSETEEDDTQIAATAGGN